MMKKNWMAAKVAGITLSVVALTAATVLGTSAWKTYEKEQAAEETALVEQENRLDTNVTTLTAAEDSQDEDITASDTKDDTDSGETEAPTDTGQDTTDDTAVIEAEVAANAYPNITVEVNKPVRINFKVTADNLNGCNNEILIPQWNITKKLSAGNNYVEFTPTETGTFTYTCWMNMISATITVVEPGAGQTGAAAPNTSSGSAIAGSCPMYGGTGIGSCAGMNGGGCRMNGSNTANNQAGNGMMY